jgi:outer membrane protein assembly factor BamB
VRVALGAGPHEVEGAVADAHARGPEAIVGGALAAEARRGGVDVALENEVELARRASQQEVADGAADEVHALVGREGVEQPRAAGIGAQDLEGLLRAAHGAIQARYPRAMFPRLRGRLRWVALGGVICLLAAGAAAAIVVTSQPGNVSHPEVEFTDTQPSTPSATQHRPSAGKHPMDDGFDWSDYGYTKQRTRFLALRAPLRPPFVTQWQVSGSGLIEFPPVLCRRSLYLEKNNGALYQVSRLTGRVRWRRKLGYLAASSPACAGHSVYAVVLTRGKGVAGGRVVGVDASNGHVRWSRNLPSRAESSPLVASGRVYFGTEDGTVYALRASDGALRWRYRAAGAVKGGLALDGGRLFFGDYGGHVHAIRQRDGSPLWQTSSAGSAFGLRAGRFYSTPAVAYGRVYLGSLDGFVYSFAASNGKLAWRHKTGGYVYSSPAVASVGAGPTVYVGSYDGRLYAFDARSGKVRWTHNAGGKISGAPTVVGDLVFYSNLSRKSSAALGAATGSLVWSTGRGAFNPVISDGRRLYFLGYSSLFMLSSPGQARSDERARQRLASAAGAGAARARRTAAHRRAVRERARKGRIARSVGRRRAALHRIAVLRRQHRAVCFHSHGRTTCRVPRPPVCVKRRGGRTVCRPRSGR